MAAAKKGRKKGARRTAGGTSLDVEVEKFINRMDRVYYQKPAGYAAYLATCGSATKLTDFTSVEAPKKKRGD